MPARLRGYRRRFGVATDNTQAIPGYKMYLRRSDGVRPAVFVAFVDIHPDPGTTVNGLARPVDEAELELLDRRERNYDRVDVTGEIDGVDGRVWTYRGSREGRERLRRGRAEGRAVVSRDYIEKVRSGLRGAGRGGAARLRGVVGPRRSARVGPRAPGPPRGRARRREEVPV